ncbi:MAG: AAA family ATPase [Pseudomonadota bacterium]
MSLRPLFRQLKTQMEREIIGQAELIESLLISLLADGHLLVEGAPGLAKTKSIKTLAQCIEADFQRIQFTPDLLPSDVTGTDIYRPQTGEFLFQAGPIFHNLVLADEINRAPAKVQSALLEAMGERQVSVGGTTYSLPDLFLVMATQNSIEQEGTYPLPEAQLDRFLMHVMVDYPTMEAERQILHLNRQSSAANTNNTMNRAIPQAALFDARKELLDLHMSTAVEDYIVHLIGLSRFPEEECPPLRSMISFGVSPRGTIALDRCARARAWLNDRDFVTPEDVQALAHRVLRHRIGLSFSAEADGMTKNQLIDAMLDAVTAP